MFDCEDLVVTCHPQIKREWIQMLFFIILVCRVTFVDRFQSGNKQLCMCWNETENYMRKELSKIRTCSAHMTAILLCR